MSSPLSAIRRAQDGRGGTVLCVSRRGWLLFGALSVIWGVPYLLIRIAVREVAPATLIFFRTAPVALVLLPVAAYRRQTTRARCARWRPLLAYTAVEIVLPWLMLFKAEERLSSSLAGLLIAAVPLVGALAARLSGDEDRFDRSADRRARSSDLVGVAAARRHRRPRGDRLPIAGRRGDRRRLRHRAADLQPVPVGPARASGSSPARSASRRSSTPPSRSPTSRRICRSR